MISPRWALVWLPFACHASVAPADRSAPAPTPATSAAPIASAEPATTQRRGALRCGDKTCATSEFCCIGSENACAPLGRLPHRADDEAQAKALVERHGSEYSSVCLRALEAAGQDNKALWLVKTCSSSLDCAADEDCCDVGGVSLCTKLAPGQHCSYQELCSQAEETCRDPDFECAGHTCARKDRQVDCAGNGTCPGGTICCREGWQCVPLDTPCVQGVFACSSAKHCPSGTRCIMGIAASESWCGTELQEHNTVACADDSECADWSCSKDSPRCLRGDHDVRICQCAPPSVVVDKCAASTPRGTRCNLGGKPVGKCVEGRCLTPSQCQLHCQERARTTLGSCELPQPACDAFLKGARDMCIFELCEAGAP